MARIMGRLSEVDWRFVMCALREAEGLTPRPGNEHRPATYRRLLEDLKKQTNIRPAWDSGGPTNER